MLICKKTNLAFSLVELLVVTVIAVSLSTAGYIYFREARLETNRDDVRSTILRVHSQLEHYLFTENKLTVTSSDLTTLNLSTTFTSPAKFYLVSVFSSDASNVYRIVAVSSGTTMQKNDATCTFFILTKALNGTITKTASNSECWGS